MPRKPIAAANWKMNKTMNESRIFGLDIRASAPPVDNVEVVLFPPYPSLKVVSIALMNSGIEIGGQNMHHEAEGAYTGEISPSMLLDTGAKWVILGHSERRRYFGETDDGIAQKVRAAINAGIKPIICVGELLEERSEGREIEVVGSQLSGCFAQVGREEAGDVVVAYEPVWAIGTGVVATPEQAADMHAFVREWVERRYGEEAAEKIRILYGGSINPDNVSTLASIPDVDGGLIGGASLDVNSFRHIIEALA
jgi:triosephosphate isomerase